MQIEVNEKDKKVYVTVESGDDEITRAEWAQDVMSALLRSRDHSQFEIASPFQILRYRSKPYTMALLKPKYEIIELDGIAYLDFFARFVGLTSGGRFTLKPLAFAGVFALDHSLNEVKPSPDTFGMPNGIGRTGITDGVQAVRVRLSQAQAFGWL